MVTVIGGVVKDYEWGIMDGLAPWCGGATGRPQAELWFGAHPSGPSPVLSADAAALPHSADSVEGDANAVASRSPAVMHVASLLDASGVPLLVKLLAAAQPLSVQVHPRAKLAGDWWEAQQAPGAEQILADANEKTELLVALSEFEAFVGWRPLAEAISILSGIPGARDAVRLLTLGDRPSAIRSLLALDDRTESVSLLPLAAKAAGLAPADCAAFEMVVRVYPGDRGALLTALLAHVSLSPGSAVFVPAGVPHSYIHGLGLEVMTTSDNVLRLGLTPKPIFVSEALDALDDTAVPQMLHVEIGEAIRPVGAPFEVRLVGARSAGNDADAQRSTDEGSTIGQPREPRSSDSRDSAATGLLPTGRFRLCLAIEGSATVTTDDGTVSLGQGTAAVLVAAEPTATVSTTGLVALVSDRGASL